MKGLDLQVLQGKRIDQFCTDNRQLFPHSTVTRWNGRAVAVLLARKPIPKEWSAAADDTGAASALTKAGLKTTATKLPVERAVLKQLAYLAHGLR
jgi:hypothetical protein